MAAHLAALSCDVLVVGFAWYAKTASLSSPPASRNATTGPSDTGSTTSARPKLSTGGTSADGSSAARSSSPAYASAASSAVDSAAGCAVDFGAVALAGGSGTGIEDVFAMDMSKMSLAASCVGSSCCAFAGG